MEYPERVGGGGGGRAEGHLGTRCTFLLLLDFPPSSNVVLVAGTPRSGVRISDFTSDHKIPPKREEIILEGFAPDDAFLCLHVHAAPADPLGRLYSESITLKIF